MPTPTEWLAEFQVNTGSAATGVQITPLIIGLANGNILVAWAEAADGAIGTAAGYDIIGKIYDPLGNVVVDSFQLNQSAMIDNEYDFDIAATNDGGFAMVYMDDSLGDPDLVTVRWSRYDATGDEIDTAVLANTNSATIDFVNPQITVSQLTNTSVVTFTRNNAGDLDVRGITIQSDGSVGTAYDAGTNGTDANQDSDVAILVNGDVVSVYEAIIEGTPTIEFRIFNGAGTETVTTTLTAGTDPKVATLANGNFVIVWNEADNIAFMVREADGTYVSTGYIAATVDDENEPNVVALPDGGFVVVWDNDSDGGLHAQLRTADGTPDGSSFVVTDVNGTTPDISVTADGRILFTWREAPNGEIHASIWDPRGGSIFASQYDQGIRNFVDTEVITGRIDGGSIFADENGDANVIYGQENIDVIFTGDNDTAYGGGGNDLLYSGGLNVTIDAGSGDDLVYAGFGLNEFLDGGIGNDTLDLTSVTADYEIDLATGETNFPTESFVNFENVVSGSGNDMLTGTSGVNIMTGGSGHDALFGMGGNDVLNGGVGDDTLEGGTGYDDINGGSGTDTASYAAAGAGVVVRLALQGVDQNTQGAGIDRLTGIENLIGSAFRDRLDGDDAGNRIEGLGGDDRIYSMGGFDVVIGGQGNDRVWGGGAFDRLYGDEGNDRLYGETGDDRLYGGADDDRLIGGAGDDEMYGGTGDDIYFVDDIGDLVVELGGEGVDRVVSSIDYTLGDNMEVLRMRTGNLNGTGNNLDNLLRGVGGSNTLRGLSGDDDIYGGTGNDFLLGGGGSDRLYGEQGQDTMTGGSGTDFFIFGEPDLGDRVAVADIITDFSQGDGDRINVRNVDANTNVPEDQDFDFIGDGAFTGTAGELRYFQTNTSTVVEMDVDGDGIGDWYIRIDGQIDLTAGDFIL